MPSSRRYNQGIRDTLIHFADGTCYWPGCPQLALHFIDGRYRLALQIAHICAVSPEGPRYDKSKSQEVVNAFENIMLLCYPHHSEIDGNEQKYTIAILAQWKNDRESRRNRRLPSNILLTPDTLEELITNAFAERDRQVQETLARLETSDQEAANTLESLADEIAELRMRGPLIDADVVGTLDSAANRLGHLQDTASWLLASAQQLGHLQDTAAFLDDSARTLGSALDNKISTLQDLIEELRGLQHGF